jgi:RHS repeat-associated protein
VRETTPGGQTTQYAYDPTGNVVSKIDGRSQETRFHYDADGRLTNIDYSDSTAARFEYDPAGHRTLEENADITRRITYDPAGRITLMEDLTASHSLGFSYDARGRRATMVFQPDGDTIRYAWDSRGLLVNVAHSNGDVFRASYDSAGQRVALTYPNGMVLSRAFDPLGRVTSQVFRTDSGGILSAFTYAFDSRGNVVSKSFADGTTEQYGYDALSRLTLARYPSGRNVVYDYDGVGNRLRLVDSVDGTTTYTYDDDDKLLSRAGAAGSATFEYDGAGHRIRMATMNETKTLTWDARGYLSRQDSTSGGTAIFGYDTGGLRVHSAVGPVDQRILLDGRDEAALYDVTTGTRVEANIHDPSSTDALLAQLSANDRYYPFSDILQSIYGLTDTRGHTVSQYGYDVFGTRRNVGGQDLTSWGFTGRRQDSQGSQLIYSRARYYDPDSSVWLSRDPAGLDADINAYRYVQNSPATFADPTGLTAIILYGYTTPVLTKHFTLTPTPDTVEYLGDFDNLDPMLIGLVRSLGFIGKQERAKVYEIASQSNLIEVLDESTSELGPGELFPQIIYMGHAGYNGQGIAESLNYSYNVFITARQFADAIRAVYGTNVNVTTVACDTDQSIGPTLHNIFRKVTAVHGAGRFEAGAAGSRLRWLRFGLGTFVRIQ